MSVQAMAWVFENSKAEMGSRLVLLSIANHARADGTGSWPSVATIAKEAHVTEREVYYVIPKLLRSGELKLEKRGGGKGRTNVYCLPRMAEMYSGFASAKGEHNSGFPLQTLKTTSQTLKTTTPNPERISPDPSLTILKDNHPSRAELFQIIDDYHQNKTHTDETGRKYKISPSSLKRIYVS